MGKRLLALVAAFGVVMTMAGCDAANQLVDTEKTDDVSIDQNNETQITLDASSEYDWGNVQIVGGGYTVGIYYNASEEGLLYARTDIGGAYRMDKESGEWIPLTDQFDLNGYNYYGIDGLATDEKEPNRVYLLAGMYTTTFDNAKLLRSEDYGETWEMTDLEFHAGGNEPNRFADRLMLDPNDSSTLYIGSRTAGLWVSHDYGVTFTKVESFPTLGNSYKEDGYTFGITAIAFDNTSSEEGSPCQTIYVGTGDKLTYFTTDGGATWNEVDGQPKSFLPYHIEICDGYVYFTFGGKAGPYQVVQGAVRKFNPETKEWTDITPDDKGHGWGDLAIDPNDHNLMYVSTMGKWGGAENDDIWRTTDGGTTWEPMFTGDGVDRNFAVNYDEAPWLDWGNENAKLGWMMGCLAINPFNSDEMMWGTGATIMATSNLTKWGEETIDVYVRCKGLEETAIFDVEAANCDEVRLYSAMGDVDGFAHTDVDSAPSNILDNGFQTGSTSISCAYNNPAIVARAGNNAKCVSISTDYGKTWKSYTPTGASGVGGTVEVNCDGSAIYWTNSKSLAIFVTYDLGETWTKLDKNFASPAIETDNFNPDVVYAFTGGNLYVSKAKGAEFKVCTLPTPEKSTLCASPEAEGELWLASTYGGVYKITDFGSGELTKTGMQSANCMAFGAAPAEGEPMAMYAIGNNDNMTWGVWRSLDGGVTWLRINDDEHQFGAIGDSIAADYKTYGQVYFGTNGRGIIMGRLK